MGVRRGLGVIASLVLLLVLIAACLGTKKAAPESSLASLVNLMERNQDVAELLVANCRLELMHANKAVEESSEVIANGRSLAKSDAQKILTVLNPKVERTLLECLRKKDLMFLVSGEEKDSKNWYIRYLDFIYTIPGASGGRRLIQSSGEAPAPSPAVPSPAPAPSIFVAPKLQLSTSPPSPPFFPQDLSNSNLHPTPSAKPSLGPSSSSDVQANKQHGTRNTVVIAIAVTAAATFVISAVLFLCCRRFCGRGSGAGKNDERPLLSLSLSDYSVASSNKLFTLSTSINNEKPSNESFNNSNHKMTGDFNIDSHLRTDSKTEIPLGTAAGGGITLAGTSSQIVGRSDTTGVPPLKPPPGRANSLGLPTGPAKARPPPPPPPPPSAPSAPLPPPLRPGGPRPPAPGPPPPPSIPSAARHGPRPPPPPPQGSSGAPPRPPPLGLKPIRPPLGSSKLSPSASFEEADAPKAKLKPFFWDKVLANPDHSMVWHQIKSGSFQFNEEMIESLFGYAPAERNKNRHKESTSQDAANQYVQIIDPKKSQNLAILLKALNVTTEEVCDALQEGNELPSELIQTLLKMAPTTDEELKLRVYSGDLSRLGPAERFLKVLVDIPFAFKRLDCLLFMCTLQEEASLVKESFATLEAACMELRKSRLFLKLLEAVLKTGNRMNDGTFRGGAQAFKLDTLLKLSDVKGIDGKTTLLHFVVREIIRSEGVRAARAAREMRSMSSIKSDDLIEDSSHDTEEHYRSMGLQVVANLGNELGNVKRAAILDADSLTGTVAKLGHALIKARDFLNAEMKNVDEENGFHQTLKSFVQNAEVDVMWLLEEEKRIMALVKSTGDYFHGNAGKDEGLRLFVIVRDFLIILDKVCKEVKSAPKNLNKPRRSEDVTTASSDPRQNSFPDPRQRLFPAIAERRMDDSSSDDESS